MTDIQRSDGRSAGQMRTPEFQRSFTKNAPGSVLVSYGDTRVLCTATYDDKVPRFRNPEPRRGEPRVPKRGWLTATYAMLPGSTNTRKERDIKNGRIDGRSSELQRLIGRTLRTAVDFTCVPKMIYVDCDVLQADGGTRTAAISGAWVALHDMFAHMQQKREIGDAWPLTRQVGAVSVGVVGDDVLCDLCYSEDAAAQTDLNLVMTSEGKFIEIQGTAEGDPFSSEQLGAMLEVGGAAIRQVVEAQNASLGIQASS